MKSDIANLVIVGDTIPMTQDAGEDALRLIVTAKGNHPRHYKNQRELDSLLHVLERGESS